MIGDVLGNFGQRLAEHGLIDGRPSLARQIALRETAKVAMTRLHFSPGIRRTELARSRSSTMSQPLEPGDIVYFWSKYNSKTAPSKKRLSLRRWHGPALLVALEGHNAGYVSFKGQLLKCAREHLRSASSMEQISARSGTMQYRIALKRHCMMSNDRAPKMLAQTFHHLRRLQWQLIQVPYRQCLNNTQSKMICHLLPPTELFQALDGGGLGVLGGGSHFGSELPGSGSLSRRASSMEASSREPSRQMSHAAPGTPVPPFITGASQASPVIPLESLTSRQE